MMRGAATDVCVFMGRNGDTADGPLRLPHLQQYLPATGCRHPPPAPTFVWPVIIRGIHMEVSHPQGKNLHVRFRHFSHSL